MLLPRTLSSRAMRSGPVPCGHGCDPLTLSPTYATKTYEPSFSTFWNAPEANQGSMVLRTGLF